MSWMLQRWHSGDGCVFASNWCKYDLRKGDLFVLNWARVRHCRMLCFVPVLHGRVWYVCCYVRRKALLQCLCNY